jgi:hypothetical protein
MSRVIASLIVAAVIALVASSGFALAGDKIQRKTGSAGCMQLSHGEITCLTCERGPCDIKSAVGTPVASSVGPWIARHSNANSPKHKLSANHPNCPANSEPKP